MRKTTLPDALPFIAVVLCTERHQVCSVHTLCGFVGCTLDFTTNNVLNLDGVFGLCVIQYYI